jgi:hypothetical protein
MRDLTEELMEVLEPFDVTMNSWLRLHHHLDNGSLLAVRQAFGYYIENQIFEMQAKYGLDACNEGLSKLFGIHDTLIRAGKLTSNAVADKILVYAAHLAAMSSYGPAVWDRAAKIVLSVAMETTEKELERSRR